MAYAMAKPENLTMCGYNTICFDIVCSGFFWDTLFPKCLKFCMHQVKFYDWQNLHLVSDSEP